MSRSLKHGLLGDHIKMTAESGLVFTPLWDRILVEPYVTPDVTEGGIVIPETAKVEENRAIVVATGRGYFDQNGNYVDQESPFNIGDAIVFTEMTGTQLSLMIDGKKKTFLILYNRDVLGLLTKEPDGKA